MPAWMRKIGLHTRGRRACGRARERALHCSAQLFWVGAQDDAQALLREAAAQLEADAPAMPPGADGGAPSKARAAPLPAPQRPRGLWVGFCCASALAAPCATPWAAERGAGSKRIFAGREFMTSKQVGCATAGTLASQSQHGRRRHEAALPPGRSAQQPGPGERNALELSTAAGAEMAAAARAGGRRGGGRRGGRRPQGGRRAAAPGGRAHAHRPGPPAGAAPLQAACASRA
jgi:hypothetical protein